MRNTLIAGITAIVVCLGGIAYAAEHIVTHSTVTVHDYDGM